MNKTTGTLLLTYGLVLAGLSYLTHRLTPAPQMLVAGLLGGLLCVVWGMRAIQGESGKAWAILTLIAVNFVALSQTITGWLGNPANQEAQAAVVLSTVILLISMGMVIRIAWAGVVFDVPGSSPPQSNTPPSERPLRNNPAYASKAP